MNEREYALLIKNMSTTHGIIATTSRRRDYERIYYDHHRKLGTRLRAKYRPS